MLVRVLSGRNFGFADGTVSILRLPLEKRERSVSEAYLDLPSTGRISYEAQPFACLFCLAPQPKWHFVSSVRQDTRALSVMENDWLPALFIFLLLFSCTFPSRQPAFELARRPQGMALVPRSSA